MSDDDDRQHLEDVLKRLVFERKVQGVSQKQMAEHLGVTQQRISQIERGHGVRVSLLQRYVRVLGGRLRIETHPLVVEEE